MQDSFRFPSNKKSHRPFEQLRMKPLIMMTSSQKKRNRNGYHHFTQKKMAPIQENILYRRMLA
ncbi:unnamed protein product [Musa acuminata subsp. malaccensis]|uniref:(wild Malaysian banana) hypothetical protein n=1 Tax=Musa acuminata subsp. malaccensis TaxID=214687 RepID=A0A804ICT6_MUSAM|nr:unnamed protein product [Musa acuminata subsp. malaccensis]